MNNSSFNPFRGTPPVVTNIIIICALMLFGTYVLRSRMGIELDQILGLHYVFADSFRPYQFITYLFMHGDFFHLLFNMFAFWMFGKVLEQVWGSKRFLIFFLVTGIGAALVQQLINYYEFTSLYNKILAYSNTPSFESFEIFIKDNLNNPTSYVTNFVDSWRSAPNNPLLAQQSIGIAQAYYTEMTNVPMVGASGAVYGILLGFGMLFPNTELMLLFPPIPIKAKYMVIVYGAMELYFGLAQPGSNIAHFAHLGGMLFGFIMIKIWNKKNPNFY